jgi:hypothetical protein
MGSDLLSPLGISWIDALVAALPFGAFPAVGAILPDPPATIELPLVQIGFTASFDREPHHHGASVFWCSHPFFVGYARLWASLHRQGIRWNGKELLETQERRRNSQPFWKTILVMEFFKEFWEFLKYNKKFWMLPILLILILIGGLLILAKGSAVAPFIYTLF